MNYTQYLQSGDTIQAPMSDEQALAHLKQKDNEAAEAIKANPSVLDKAIQDYGEETPAFIKHMIDVAAENQDEELLEILKPYAEKFNIMSFRCGGKVRAKIKKACSGKKMEKGGEAPIKKEAKGGKPCPCTLHKVGGKLIEVDCNGIPVAKNGAVLYAKPGTELPPALASQAVRNYMTAKPVSSAIPFSDQWFGDLGNTFVNWADNTFGKGSAPAFKPLFGGSASISSVAQKPAQPTDSELVIESPEWQAQQRKNQAAFEQTPEGQVAKQKADLSILAKQEEAAREAARREAARRSSTLNPVPGLFASNGLANMQSFAARKAWLLDPRNAEYVLKLGWSPASYKGTAEQNKALLSMLLAQKLYAEDAQQLEEELNAMKAQNEGLRRLESPTLNPTRITPDNSSAGQINLGTTRTGQLINTNNLTAGLALSQLSNSSWNAYQNRLRQNILSSKNGGTISYKEYMNL